MFIALGPIIIPIPVHTKGSGGGGDVLEHAPVWFQQFLAGMILVGLILTAIGFIFALWFDSTGDLNFTCLSWKIANKLIPFGLIILILVMIFGAIGMIIF